MFRYIARPLALVLALSGAAVVHAQPDAVPVQPGVPGAESFVHVAVVVDQSSTSLFNIEARNSSIAQVLMALAGRENLNVVAKAGVSGTVATLSLHNVPPEKALSTVCREAGLTCALEGNTWVVLPLKATPAKTPQAPVIDDMVFSDTDACEVLTIISTEFHVAVLVGDDVKGRIPFIRLGYKTPREAIEAVALAINAQVTQDEDGTLIVGVKPKAQG